MYFETTDNAWRFWYTLREMLFVWYSNEKLLSINIPNNFSQLLLSMMEPLRITEIMKPADKDKWTNNIQ